MKIGIVTDSTADLSPELIEEYGIEVVPLTVSIHGKEYRDGVDISSDDFYRELKKDSLPPSTSQPAPGAFIDCYRSLLTKFDAIISIHLTEILSGTVRTAQLVREMLPDARIQVIDSRTTSVGLGGMVLEAARAVRKGVKFDQVVEGLKGLRESVHFVVALDTLEHVCRGGRVGKLMAFLGSILRIKPILQLGMTDVEIIDKVRSRRDAIVRLFEEFKSHVAEETEAIIGIAHTAAEEEAEKLKILIEATFKNAEIIFRQAGPVLGTHVGPGALALVWVPKIST
jgi:DegV family protein with EDD domain